MDYYKAAKRLWLAFIGLALFVLLFILSVNVNLFNLFGKLPALDVLENPRSEVASEIYSSDLVLLGKYYSGFNRSPIEYNELPAYVVNALIATEDVRFHEHSGIDFKALFAIPAYILKGGKRGSSTITQQLAKNLFKIRNSPEYKGLLSNTIAVIKVKEMITAIRLEKAYTKNEILLMYLNTVDFGSNSFGIKTAARTYFNTSPKKLTLTQAATLIGTLKGTTFYSPIKHPAKALDRRNTVLSQMLKYGYITEKQFLASKEKKLNITYTLEDENSGLAPYFRSYIKDYLLKWCAEHDKSLYEDGLRIYTTIDSRMQKHAEYAVEKHMKYLQKEFFAHWKGRAPWTDANFKEIKNFIKRIALRSDRYQQLKQEYGDNESAIWKEMNTPEQMRVFTWKGPKDTTLSPMDSIRYMMHFLHAGFMAMDPKMGYVKAWVGGIDFRFFKYDHVKQSKRQVGSTFKPFVYAYALEHGFTPCNKVLDVPVTITLADGKTWKPNNSNGVYSGQELTLKQALARSVNTVTAYLVQKFNPADIAKFAEQFGITGPLETGPTIGLGTSDVSVYEMTGGYSVFVNDGSWNEPTYLLRIEDKDGNVLQEFAPAFKQVISDETAYNMVQMLKGTTEEASGTAISLKSVYHLNYEVGGKTGTTQGSSDGWFMGISPELVAGTWVGGEHRSIRFRDMRLGQGARMALPIFAYFMQKVYADPSLRITDYEFQKPDGVKVETDCAVSDSLQALPADTIPDSNFYFGDPTLKPDFENDLQQQTF